MSQCVPSWDLDNNLCPPMLPNCSGLNLSEPLDVPVWDNHVTELAWENGHLSMHGFVKANPSSSVASSPVMKHVNLEPIVDHDGLTPDDLVPCFDELSHPQSVPMDAMVPCYLPPIDPDPFNKNSVGGDTHSASGSVTFDRTAKEKTAVQPDAALHMSQAYSYRDYVDLDPIHPQPSAIVLDDQKKENVGKSSSSTKRSRVAAVHNLSERKRRDRINQRIKTLQSLVPKSTKTDKVSVLDEVIEYVKQLKADAQAKDKPPAAVSAPAEPIQQRLPVPLLGSMGVGVGMGLGLSLVGMNSMQRPVVPSVPAPLLHPSVIMPFQGWERSAGSTLFPPHPVAVLQDPLSAFFKSQSISMDAFYRQISHDPSSTSRN